MGVIQLYTFICFYRMEHGDLMVVICPLSLALSVSLQPLFYKVLRLLPQVSHGVHRYHVHILFILILEKGFQKKQQFRLQIARYS